MLGTTASQSIAPNLAADAFANEESIDADGNPIRLGDRVECLNDSNDGVVIALAFDVALIISDYDDGTGKRGNAFYCSCNELRLKLPVSDVVDFVNRVRREAADDAASRQKSVAEAANEIDPDYEAVSNQVEALETKALAALDDSDTRPELAKFERVYLRGEFRKLGEQLGMLADQHREESVATLNAAKSGVQAAFDAKVAAQPAIVPGVRIYDVEHNEGGIALLIEGERNVIFLRDTSEYGYNELTIASFDQCVVNEDIPPMPRDELLRLMAKFAPSLAPPAADEAFTARPAA